eukprot:CAMPEP_0181202614 /NCGR_PEP_ID=MMETSP1096-20121128/18944_1 /TAXON_ID=156174 ORGANISM="Chrysochromulina ericina, Strain CCMP281" /NCGR_SAMPLE_ID=MMETSP1096 /ASSEMBLY_ACC=CAM_ASM_000453 /LENGTH=169 /DNA_ID=CAMNT_0023293155 /DNA_START=321 /DNA_END=830 /DNA_ORIENTATION=-
MPVATADMPHIDAKTDIPCALRGHFSCGVTIKGQEYPVVGGAGSSAERSPRLTPIQIDALECSLELHPQPNADRWLWSCGILSTEASGGGLDSLRLFDEHRIWRRELRGRPSHQLRQQLVGCERANMGRRHPAEQSKQRRLCSPFSWCQVARAHHLCTGNLDGAAISAR